MYTVVVNLNNISMTCKEVSKGCGKLKPCHTTDCNSSKNELKPGHQNKFGKELIDTGNAVH